MFHNTFGRVSSNAVLALVLVSAIVIGVSIDRPVFTQTTDAVELGGIRRALDQIVTLLKDSGQQSLRRDNVAILSQRLEASERRLAVIERDLKQAQEEMTGAEAKIVEAQGAIQSMNEMAKLDKTGSAAEVIRNELARLQGEIDRRSGTVASASQRVSALEADVARRRQIVAQLELALDQQLGIK